MHFKPKLLIAEESPAAIKAIQQGMGEAYEIDVVQDGQALMDCLVKGMEYDAVILQLNLPRVDGYQILKYMEHKNFESPTIAVAENAEESAVAITEALPLGAAAVVAKPLNVPKVEKMIQSLIGRTRQEVDSQIPVDLDTGLKFPFRKVKRYCYICGYEDVTAFIPVTDGYEEDWSHGPFPVYKAKAGFREWDLLKTLVSVCPYCFFASTDPRDFGSRKKSTYPFTQDSKNILARSITTRRRMVPEAKREDDRFRFAEREPQTVLYSLQLAEKCCNGLILGGKVTAPSQAGLCLILQGAMLHPKGKQHFQDAHIHFQNQLKTKDTLPAIKVRAEYFIIVLNMLLGQTANGREILKDLENHYFDKRPGEVTEEERLWLARISEIWKTGVDLERPRELK